MNHEKTANILYIQYTNPAAYPPLEHSSHLLSNSGWQVKFLGIHVAGVETIQFAQQPNITVHYLGLPIRGWRQKLNYALYGLWVLVWVIRWRPQWVYASDLLSCPIALLLSYLPNVRLVYHEHDSPPISQQLNSVFLKFAYWSRQILAHRVATSVLPNEARAQRFCETTNTQRPVMVVMNCPEKQEIGVAKVARSQESFWIFYHGSIVPSRIPLTIVDALTKLPPHVKLRIAGYETSGHHQGYPNKLQTYAEQVAYETELKHWEQLQPEQNCSGHCQLEKG
ncbi:MAG: hypothetical protein R3E79_31930 [Caldilineaceae bacterium]